MLGSAGRQHWPKLVFRIGNSAKFVDFFLSYWVCGILTFCGLGDKVRLERTVCYNLAITSVRLLQPATDLGQV